MRWIIVFTWVLFTVQTYVDLCYWKVYIVFIETWKQRLIMEWMVFSETDSNWHRMQVMVKGTAMRGNVIPSPHCCQVGQDRSQLFGYAVPQKMEMGKFMWKYVFTWYSNMVKGYSIPKWKKMSDHEGSQTLHNHFFLSFFLQSSCVFLLYHILNQAHFSESGTK